MRRLAPMVGLVLLAAVARADHVHLTGAGSTLPAVCKPGDRFYVPSPKGDYYCDAYHQWVKILPYNGTNCPAGDAAGGVDQFGNAEDCFTPSGGPGGGAPTTATYITQTPNGSLSAEQALSALGTGLVKNTTTTGVLSIYAGASCTNQFIRSLDASAAATCATITSADTSGTFTATAHALLGTTHSGTVEHTPVLGDLIIGNSTPAWDALAGNTTTTRKFLSQTGNGSVSAAPSWVQPAATDVTGLAASATTDTTTPTYITQTASANLANEQAMGALGTGLVKNTTTTGVQSIYAGTSCTNQFTRSLDGSGAATCASVAPTDMASQAARSVVGNATASSAAPTATTTVDVLAYQTAEIPSSARVASSDFTTAGNTNLQAITGLTWTMPANTVLNISFDCYLQYSIATAAAAVSFGIQDVSIAPTAINAQGLQYTSATASTEGTLVNLASTTATAIVTATPSAITTVWAAQLHGMIEQPSNASSSAINIMVKTATAADVVSVKRGSYCTVGF